MVPEPRAVSGAGRRPTPIDDPRAAVRAALRALAHEDYMVGRDRLLEIVADRPAWADAWALLSGAQLALADVDAATAASERALALAPDAFLPRMKSGELAFRLGDVERAEAEFLAALRATDPETSDAAAAKRALAIARAAQRAGIAHRAELPGAGRGRRLLATIRSWSVPRPERRSAGAEADPI